MPSRLRLAVYTPGERIIGRKAVLAYLEKVARNLGESTYPPFMVEYRKLKSTELKIRALIKYFGGGPKLKGAVLSVLRERRGLGRKNHVWSNWLRNCGWNKKRPPVPQVRRIPVRREAPEPDDVEADGPPRPARSPRIGIWR